VALDVLAAVLRRRQPLDEALETHPVFAALDLRDRAFVHNLVATTLRRLGQVDALVEHFLCRPLPKDAAAVRDVLRLGACQLVFLATPPHAGVHASVELARSRRLHHHLALINALLRRLSGEGRALAEAEDAVRCNTPDWLWSSWTEAYGENLCRQIGAAHLSEPPLDLTAATDPAGVARAVGGERLPTGTVRLQARGPVAELPGFAAGQWWVQDVSAALPVRLLGDVAGRRILDLCAAPGGKTAQLASAGGRVVAIDRSAQRMERLRENLRRLRLSAETVVADASQWRPDVPASAALLDAPCTATGTIRRHPDILWCKQPADVAALAPVQARLLAAAAEMVGPGGVLVYCVCSLQPEEGPEQIARFLAAAPDWRREPLRPGEIPGTEELVTPAGDLRTLPSHLQALGGMDGSYAARLRRR
jgi:16S rRNA (cytosine967-C5)-methyltransferase